MAGTVNKQNIIVGAASLYLGPNFDGTGTDPKPTFLATESYRTTLDKSTGVSANWNNVGYTMEGLELSYEPDYGDVEVDQLLDSALIFKQSMKVSLNTTLAEATLFNLMVAWGQSSATLTSDASQATLDIDGGALQDAPVERGLIAVSNGVYGRGSSASYSERVWHAFRVLNVDQVTVGAKRSEATGVPVSFRALPANTGKYGVIKDRVKTW